MSVYSQAESNIATSPNGPSQDKSLGELFGELTRETSDLVRQELNLAKVEMTQKATRVAKDAGLIAAGAFVAYVGLLALVAAAVYGLAAAGLALWSASLIVGLVFCVGGGVVALQGVNAIKRIDPVPRQTVETLKEDQEWVKSKR